MDDCLPGSEEFEQRKNMLRLLGMEYRSNAYISYIVYEGEVYAQSAFTEDEAWRNAWSRLNRST